jgi:hypothetical protein
VAAGAVLGARELAPVEQLAGLGALKISDAGGRPPTEQTERQKPPESRPIPATNQHDTVL